jgi:hypothetical protein
MLRTPNIINGEYRTTMTAEEQRRNDVLRQRLQEFVAEQMDDPNWQRTYEFYVHASDEEGIQKIARDGVSVSTSSKNGGGFFTSQSVCGAEYFGIRKAGEGEVRGVVVLIPTDQARTLAGRGSSAMVTRPVSDHPYIRETVFRGDISENLINHGTDSFALPLPRRFFEGGYE